MGTRRMQGIERRRTGVPGGLDRPVGAAIRTWDRCLPAFAGAIGLLGVALWPGVGLHAQGRVGAGGSSTVTRGAMAVAVTGALHLTPESVGPSYADVGPSLGRAIRGAILTGADQGLWGAWSPGERFRPGAPATVGQMLSALETGEGYGHVVADVPGGIARVAHAFGIWPTGATSVHAFLTRAELRFATEHLPRNPPRAAIRLAEDTVRKVVFQSGPTTVSAGGSSWVLVTPQDGAGYTVPVPYQASATAGTLETARAMYVAPDRVGPRGETAVLTAHVGHVTGHLTLHVVPLGGLGFVPAVPTVARVGQVLTVTGAVLSRRAPFAGDNGRSLTLTVRSAGRSIERETVEDQAGVAPFRVALPRTATGPVTLSLAARGFRTRTATIRLTGRSPGPMRLIGPGTGPGPVRIGSELHFTVRPGSGWPAGTALAKPQVVLSGPLRNAVVRSLDHGTTWQVSAVSGPYGGQGRIEVSEPGAGSPVTAVTVAVLGAPAIPLVCRPDVAGSPLRVRIGTVAGRTARVGLDWSGPAGQSGSAAGGAGTSATLLRPTLAGPYRVTGFASGHEAATVTCVVTPGRPTHLGVHLTPTPFLRPGGRAQVWVGWEDRYGNAVGPATHVYVRVSGQVALTGQPAKDPRDHGVDAAEIRASGTGSGEVIVTASGRGRGVSSVTVRRPVTILAHPASLFKLPGMWLPYWIWQAEAQAKLFAQARASGIRVIYLEVATSANGYYGAPALARFVASAHSHGLAVVPWVYADLASPAADLANVRNVMAEQAPDGTRPDGFASDLEGNAALPPWAVAPFLAALRKAVGPEGSLLVVTYPPNSLAPSYGLVARYASAIGPMDYWHGSPVDMGYLTAYDAVASSVRGIEQAAPGAVVVPVLEAFDMFTPTGMGAYSPTPGELAGAIAAVHATGAEGLSYYQWGTVTPAEWAVIRRLGT